MKEIDFLNAQAQLAKTMRQVCETGTPIAINGLGKDEVVVMSLVDFYNLQQRADQTLGCAKLEPPTEQVVCGSPT